MFLFSFSRDSSMQADCLCLDSQPTLFVRRQSCGGLQTNRKLMGGATISFPNRLQHLKRGMAVRPLRIGYIVSSRSDTIVNTFRGHARFPALANPRSRALLQSF
jgi:hypothetical protein